MHSSTGILVEIPVCCCVLSLHRPPQSSSSKSRERYTALNPVPRISYNFQRHVDALWSRLPYASLAGAQQMLVSRCTMDQSQQSDKQPPAPPAECECPTGSHQVFRSVSNCLDSLLTEASLVPSSASLGLKTVMQLFLSLVGEPIFEYVCFLVACPSGRLHASILLIAIALETISIFSLNSLCVFLWGCNRLALTTIIFRPNFRPQTVNTTISVHDEGSEVRPRVILDVVTINHVLDEFLSLSQLSLPDGDLGELYSLGVRFLAAAIVPPSPARAWLLSEPKFHQFFGELLLNSHLSTGGIGPLATESLEVMFTWFAFLPFAPPVDNVAADGGVRPEVHPFDQFCMTHLRALVTTPPTAVMHDSSTSSLPSAVQER